MHATLQTQLAGDDRHHRIVAIVADAHLHLAAEVDALDELEETVHEMLARLLAVADDVDAGVFLLLQPEQRRVPLGALELGARRFPRRPELLRFGEPSRLGEASCEGGFEHVRGCRDFETATISRYVTIIRNDKTVVDFGRVAWLVF